MSLDIKLINKNEQDLVQPKTANSLDETTLSLNSSIFQTISEISSIPSNPPISFTASNIPLDESLSKTCPNNDSKSLETLTDGNLLLKSFKDNFLSINEAWQRKITALRTENSKKILQMHEIYISMHTGNIEDQIKDEINLIKNIEPKEFDEYLTLIEKIALLKNDLEEKLQKVEAFFNEDGFKEIKKSFPEIADKFETCVKDEIQRLREIPDKKINVLVKEAFTHFYINTFDNYPDLHRDFDGFLLEKELRYMNSDILNFYNENRSLKEKFQLALMSCSIKMQEALSCNSIESPERKIKFMENQVNQLSIGESCIFEGMGKDHAIIYEIIRNSNDSYTFTIINTGHDEQGASKRKPKGLSGLFVRNRYAHKSYLVPASVLNAEFLKSILPSATGNTPTPDLVKQIDHYLTSKKGVQPQLGRLHHFQQRGNCSAKAASSWLKGELIRQLGQEEGAALYRQFKCFRAENNYTNIIKLKSIAPEDSLKKAYSNRTYKPSNDPNAEPELIKERPATDEELTTRLKELHSASCQVMGIWNKKAEKARKVLN